MDPEATLSEIITLAITGETREAAELIQILRRWEANGGFAPDFEAAMRGMFSEVEELAEGMDED